MVWLALALWGAIHPMRWFLAWFAENGVSLSGLVAAWRPRWSLPCAVSATVALFAQMVAGVADETIAETGGNELVHAPAIALAFLLAASAVRLGPLGPPRTRTSP